MEVGKHPAHVHHEIVEFAEHFVRDYIVETEHATVAAENFFVKNADIVGRDVVEIDLRRRVYLADLVLERIITKAAEKVIVAYENEL